MSFWVIVQAIPRILNKYSWKVSTTDPVQSSFYTAVSTFIRGSPNPALSRTSGSKSPCDMFPLGAAPPRPLSVLSRTDPQLILESYIGKAYQHHATLDRCSIYVQQCTKLKTQGLKHPQTRSSHTLNILSSLTQGRVDTAIPSRDRLAHALRSRRALGTRVLRLELPKPARYRSQALLLYLENRRRSDTIACEQVRAVVPVSAVSNRVVGRVGVVKSLSSYSCLPPRIA